MEAVLAAVMRQRGQVTAEQDSADRQRGARPREQAEEKEQQRGGSEDSPQSVAFAPVADQDRAENGFQRRNGDRNAGYGEESAAVELHQRAGEHRAQEYSGQDRAENGSRDMLRQPHRRRKFPPGNRRWALSFFHRRSVVFLVIFS